MSTIDFERLTEWLDQHGVGSGPLEQLSTLAGGTQNTLIRFTRSGYSLVLRCPPEHKRTNSDETMRREARVLAALAGSAVPHPRLVAACATTEVLGSAFYVMEEVAGDNPTVVLPAGYQSSETWRRTLGLAMSDAAAAIADVDHEAAGLGDLGRAEGYLQRQTRRWSDQLASYQSAYAYTSMLTSELEQLADWLDRNLPTASRPGLIHGDFHFANVMCLRTEPGLAAIVDWELATIGDPLVDLGWLLATWPGQGDPVPSLRLRPWDGFPRREELLNRYAERTARDLSAIVWYEVLACYKLAIILEGTFARSLAGEAPDDTGRQLHENARRLVQRGAGLAGRPISEVPR